MIIVFDFYADGRAHLPFNTSLFQLLRATYDSEQILFFANGSHLREVRQVEGWPARIDTYPIPRWVASNAGRQQSRLIHQTVELFEPQHIMILGAKRTLMPELGPLARKHARVGWDIVFHGSLAEPARWRSRNPLVRRRDLFGVLASPQPRNMRLLFLEQAIAKNARQKVHPATATAVLEHPILGTTRKSRQPADHQINIAFPGTASVAKGFGSFLAAVRSCHSPIMRFHCIGRASADYDRANDILFATPPGSEAISQSLYDERLSEADLICLPLDKTTYSWIASGTLIDCIRFAVPPIVTRTDVVDDLTRRYGPFGYVLDRTEDLGDFIRSLTIDRLQEELPLMRANLERIAHDRSVESLARSFRLHTPVEAT